MRDGEPFFFFFFRILGHDLPITHYTNGPKQIFFFVVAPVAHWFKNAAIDPVWCELYARVVSSEQQKSLLALPSWPFAECAQTKCFEMPHDYFVWTT